MVEEKREWPAPSPGPNPPGDGPEGAPSGFVSSAAAMMVVLTAVVGLSLYANMASFVKNPASFRFFPPFEAFHNRNNNDHLGAEYYNIAGALISGRGYADPFEEQTGPTAWMAPVLSWLLAGLRWLAGGDKETVVALFVLLQDLTLIGTGVLVLALARRTTGRVWLATLVLSAALLYNFRLCFQFTHDCWIILAAIDLLIAGLVWLQPLAQGWRRAVLWGGFGGLCALVSPVVGFTWGVLALTSGGRRGQRGRLAVALLASIVTISPWVIRNYLVFGRLIPVKSNLAYELYQSQCLQRGGVLQAAVFGSHPYVSANRERRDYQRLGEMEYLDRKWELFCEAVRENPGDFLGRIGKRFLAATLIYSPYAPQEENRHPWILRFTRWTYPLPFLCLLFLVVTAPLRSLGTAQWLVIAVYLTFLLPYVVVSYYDRYKFPLVVTETMLILFAADRVRRFLVRPTVWVEPAADAEEVYEFVDVDSPPEPEAVLPSVRFLCPGCAGTLQAKASLSGKTIQCPKCGTEGLVPATEAERTD
jgi:hypothetical protein